MSTMYTYRAAIWCSDCLAAELGIEDSRHLPDTLELELLAHGIDPLDEWQWDSDDFPKSVPPFHSGLQIDCH